MLNDDQAAEAALATLQAQHPRCPLVARRTWPSASGAQVFVEVNTAAYVNTGDPARALVGLGVAIVDRRSGEVELLRPGLDPEQLLAERAEAAGPAPVWGLGPAADASPAAILTARRWLGASPAEARALMRGGPWLIGPGPATREAADTLVQAGLSAMAAPVEAGPGGAAGALPLPWSGETEALRGALLAYLRAAAASPR
jgi:hypothetical protein